MGPVIMSEALRDWGRRLLRDVPGVLAVMAHQGNGVNEPPALADPLANYCIAVYYRDPIDLCDAQRVVHGIASHGITFPLGRSARNMDARAADWWPADGGVEGEHQPMVGDRTADCVFRDIEDVHERWQQVQHGRFRFSTRVGQPFRVPDFSCVAEVAVGVVVADPSGEVSELQRRAQSYPPALGEALVARLWEAGLLLDSGRRAADRCDVAYVAGTLAEVVVVCVHALHGHAGRWAGGGENLVEAAGRLAAAPAGFSRTVQHILGHLGTRPDELRTAVSAASDLLTQVAAACRTAKPPPP
ncbi:MAG TPA: hypothetical protein VIT42_05115 [Microlunatus sp.]